VSRRKYICLYIVTKQDGLHKVYNFIAADPWVEFLSDKTHVLSKE